MAKLSKDMMEGFVFKKNIHDDRVVMGPAYGEDAAVVKIGDEYLVVHSDPISGAVENIGSLSVHIAANDIAVSGASPRWMLPTLQFPSKYKRSKIKGVFEDIYETVMDLDINIIGGHSETVDALDQPLLTSCMMGVTKKPVFTKGANPGDKIVQIHEAGLEGTWILASDFEKELKERGVHEEMIKKALTLQEEISVVNSALSIKEKVSSMHDPTEGGIIQGLYEMAQASENKFVIDSEPMVMQTTVDICEALRIEPFKLISSGCLLATVPKNHELDEGKVIGKVEKGAPMVNFMGEDIEEVLEDELFKARRFLNHE